MKNICADIRMMLKSPSLYICIVIATMVVLNPIRSYLFTDKALKLDMSPLALTMDAFATSGFTPFAVVACLFPYSTIFCDEFKSGLTRYVLPRTTRSRYAAGKIASVWFSGALTLTSVTAVVFFIALVKGNYAMDNMIPDFFFSSIWSGIAWSGEWQWILVYKLMFAALFGGVWSLVGLMCSGLFLDRFVGLVLPFAIYQGLWGVLMDSPLNPVGLLRGDLSFIPSISFIVIVQVSYTIVLSLVCFLIIVRRCGNA